MTWRLAVLPALLAAAVPVPAAAGRCAEVLAALRARLAGSGR